MKRARNGQGRARFIAGKDFVGSKSVCMCGHAGDGEQTSHGGPSGEGMCCLPDCACPGFRWLSYTEHFQQRMKEFK